MDSPALTLLAPAPLVTPGLVVPRLGAIPRPRGRKHAQERIARLALAMLELGIAHPSQWAGDAGKFVELAFARWVEEHGGRTIRRRFALVLQLTTSRTFMPWDASEWPDVFLFCLYPEIAASYQLGATFDALEVIRPGLAATVWRRGLTGLWTVAPTYAWDEAIECAEWHNDGLDEEDNDNAFRPARPDALRRKPLTLRQLQRLAARNPQVATIARHLEAVRGAAARCRRIRQQLWWAPLGNIDDLGEPLPVALFQTSEYDDVSAAFDWRYNAVDLEPQPVVSVAMTSLERGAVARAFAAIEATLTLFVAVTELLDVLPALEGYNDAGEQSRDATLVQVLEQVTVLQQERNAPPVRELVRVVA